MSLALSSLLSTVACGSFGADSSNGIADFGSRYGRDASSAQCFGANDCPAGDECNQFGYCVPIQPSYDDAGMAYLPDSSLPPEVVLRPELPASGRRYVYVAISNLDSVARIDSQDLSVNVIPVGHDPGALHTVPGQDVAVLLDRGAASITILRAQQDGTDQVTTLPSVAGLNRLSLSPDGKYAIAWFDVRLTGGALDPHAPFQDATLVKLADGNNPDQALDLSIGFKPSEVQFSADDSQAFVITDQGVSIVTFAQVTQPTIVPTVALRKDIIHEPVPDLVVVTGDGARALASLPMLSALRVVDLASGAITDLPLDAQPSDIEVTADSSLAVVVVRDASEVALAAIPGDLASGTFTVLSTMPYVAGQAVLTADGGHAFLFSNAVEQKVLLDVDLQAKQLTGWPLEKSVRNVLASPDGHTAIVIHNKTPGVPMATDTFADWLDKHQGYSLFDVRTGYVKLEITDAAPGDIAFTADSSSAYVLLGDETANPPVREVAAADLTGFQTTDVALGSPPVAVGVVAATSQIYVAQDHPLGRMTFVDTKTFKTRTLTGYGLNSQIIE